jgi:hypothetical protein
MDRYVLNESGEPVPEPDLIAWGRWMGDGATRRVAMDWVGDVRVSTVFLGLDHSFVPGGAPVLWETMIFGGEHDGHTDRYTSQAEAIAGHASAVELARAHAAGVAAPEER